MINWPEMKVPALNLWVIGSAGTVTNDKLRKFGFASGNESLECKSCKKEFLGSKRSVRCESCARAKQIREDRISNIADKRQASELIEVWHSKGVIADSEYHRLVSLNNAGSNG